MRFEMEHNNKSKILVVDDEEEIVNLIELLLKNDYDLTTAFSGEEALELINDFFDLVILDIMMKGIDGYEVCRTIREKYNIPILFLSGKTSEQDKTYGFLVGCDDYGAKPFSSIEFLSRVNAIIRRYKVYKGKTDISGKDRIIVADIVIDEFSNKIYRDEEEILLTNIEFNIFYLMAKNPRKIFSIQNIYESVWKEPYEYTVNNIVMVHMKNLRKKLAKPGSDIKYIKNVWGRGYCIENG